MRVPTRQLSFLPSEDVYQAETLQPAREPDCDVQPLAGLPRHPYNSMLGDRTPDEIERMKETLKTSSHTIQIWTLDGHVLSDWDEYCTAVEESLPTNIQGYIGDDPAAFACAQAFHGLDLNKSQRALRVVLAFPWAEHGRPKNPVESTGFPTNGLTPRTAAQMAKLANCCVATISQARRIDTGGVAEQVITRQLTVDEALRRIKEQRTAGLANGASPQGAVGNEISPGNQGAESDTATAGDTPASGSDWKQQHTHGADGLTLENARLNDQIRAVEQENTRLKFENARLSGQVRSMEQENIQSNEQVLKLKQEISRLTEPPAEADAARLRGQISQLEARLHSQEEHIRREKRRADAAETDLALVRHQPQQAA